MSQSDLRHFSIALEQAHKSTLAFQLGACLVLNGQTISSSYNQDRTVARLPQQILSNTRNYGSELPPFFLSHSGSFLCPSLHAEVATLLKASKLLHPLSTKKKSGGSMWRLLRTL